MATDQQDIVHKLVAPHIEAFLDSIKVTQEKVLMLAKQAEGFPLNEHTAHLAAGLAHGQMKSLDSLNADLQDQLRTMNERLNDAARSMKESEQDLEDTKKVLEQEKVNLGDAMREHREMIAALEQVKSEVGSVVPTSKEAQAKVDIMVDLMKQLDSTITSAKIHHDKSIDYIQKEYKDTVQKLQEEKAQAEQNAALFEQQSKALQEEVARLKESEKANDVRMTMAVQAAVRDEKHYQEARAMTQREYIQKVHGEEVKELNQLLKAAVDRLESTIREQHQSVQAAIPSIREIIEQFQAHVDTDE